MAVTLNTAFDSFELQIGLSSVNGMFLVLVTLLKGYHFTSFLFFIFLLSCVSSV